LDLLLIKQGASLENPHIPDNTYILSLEEPREADIDGDFNDGPGIDYFEDRYLTHNVTDILLRSTFRPEMLLRHAFLNAFPKGMRDTYQKK
jgi:hypothetical protein